MKSYGRIRQVLILQAIIFVYSVNSIAAKLASGQEAFSGLFLLYCGLEVLVLGIYAILWQQAIKHFDISVAYANKAMVLLWGLLWGVVFFGDRVSAGKLAGIAMVIAGVILINRGEHGNGAESNTAREEEGAAGEDLPGGGRS